MLVLLIIFMVITPMLQHGVITMKVISNTNIVHRQVTLMSRTTRSAVFYSSLSIGPFSPVGGATSITGDHGRRFLTPAISRRAHTGS